jgi:hypothetical protein
LYRLLVICFHDEQLSIHSLSAIGTKKQTTTRWFQLSFAAFALESADNSLHAPPQAYVYMLFTRQGIAIDCPP